jgi:Mg2+ and Co2+ transporter CorA
LPIGPNFDEAAGLGAAVADVRDDIIPIAEQLRGSTESIEALSASSDDLIAQLGSLRDDVAQLDRDLSNSERLIDGYQENAAEARRLAVESQDDLDRQVTMSRILIVVLALAIAVGQLATYRIGHELAKPRTQE